MVHTKDTIPITLGLRAKLCGLLPYIYSSDLGHVFGRSSRAKTMALHLIAHHRRHGYSNLTKDQHRVLVKAMDKAEARRRDKEEQIVTQGVMAVE